MTGSERNRAVQASSRADEISFDNIQIKLNQLDTSMAAAKLNVSKIKDTMGEKQHALSLQKNRYSVVHGGDRIINYVVFGTRHDIY